MSRPLALVEIQTDAEGNAAEYLDFENTGSLELDLPGWTVSDDAGNQFSFADGTVLDPATSPRS